MKWYVKAIKNYAGFTGRARRKEFWLFCLFSYMVLVLYGFFKAILHLPEYKIETYLGMIYLLAILVPCLAVTLRRLHDTGKSGYWICIGLIPLIGQFILLIMLCQDSEKEENQYGGRTRRQLSKRKPPEDRRFF
ncbi:DUF805 domain-containing protein [Bacillus haynesii]|uniref:DUF805 domain-containing protein n=1 Tax=Bacillus haynesii TaxID=1925021 RepID=UPI0022807793|nr:DUF805 domain-containing protein [Bacillus haynesii]MCY8143389.1 DUF805 domain-containing protein [Bacillus haynesii]MCY8678870.1 DUF805 domain-containing protein [Bacillus haynesii]MCY9244358.1 DUF805 domain-containing protein [Bacillus haynesii]MCY9321962.1 DUF805 domain-containing protein [Bacillus haynesii]